MRQKYVLMFIFILFIFTIILLIVIRTDQSNSKISSKSSETEFTTNQNLVQDTVPFEELTIPYLRKYYYESQLGELDQISQNSKYTSYLTNYVSDDFKIDGLLTIPDGEQPSDGWPAIIFIHGYIPPDQYKTLSKYVEYVDYLARSGFVVFKIDLRGHGESEGDAHGAYYSSDYIRDVMKAQTALQQTDFVNPSKIGLWGHSMAGNIVSRTMAARPEITTGVIWAGAVYTYQDMKDYAINDSSYIKQDINYNKKEERERLFDIHGTFSSDSLFWNEVSPIEYLKDSNSAIQIHHAVNDSVVSIEYSRNLVEKTKESNLKIELWEYPNGGHNIEDPSFSLAMQRTVEFYTKHFE